MNRTTIGVMLAAALAGAAFAATDQPSPYAGQERREIKALTPEETRGLLNGEGMMLSLAAELNGHPGPRHVTELADRLSLSAEQRARALALEAEMKAAAVAIGTEIVGLEGKLEQAFRATKPDTAAIEALVATLGAKRGALRAVHLRAHIAMSEALTVEQRARYMALRGYGAGPAPHAPQHHRHHK